jgi:glycosyl transferase family 25
VINLDDSRERWDEISRALATAGLPALRLPAIDGRSRPATSFDGYDDEGARRVMGRALLGGELGCFASHRAFLDAFLASGRRFGLALEDDAVVSATSVARLRDALRVLARTENWDVVNCCAAPNRFCREIAEGEGTGLVRAYYYPMRTTALLWSQAGARRFIAGRSRVVQPIDLEIREFVGEGWRGLAFRPPLFPPAPGTSTIGAQTDTRSIKNRTLAYRARVFNRRSRDNLHALLGWSMGKVITRT